MDLAIMIAEQAHELNIKQCLKDKYRLDILMYGVIRFIIDFTIYPNYIYVNYYDITYKVNNDTLFKDILFVIISDIAMKAPKVFNDGYEDGEFGVDDDTQSNTITLKKNDKKIYELLQNTDTSTNDFCNAAWNYVKHLRYVI